MTDISPSVERPSAAAPEPGALLSLQNIHVRFEQPVDLAGRIANLFGAGIPINLDRAITKIGNHR